MVDEEELLEESQASWQDKLDQEEEEEDLDVEEEVQETEEDLEEEVRFLICDKDSGINHPLDI